MRDAYQETEQRDKIALRNPPRSHRQASQLRSVRCRKLLAFTDPAISLLLQMREIIEAQKQSGRADRNGAFQLVDEGLGAIKRGATRSGTGGEIGLACYGRFPWGAGRDFMRGPPSHKLSVPRSGGEALDSLCGNPTFTISSGAHMIEPIGRRRLQQHHF